MRNIYRYLLCLLFAAQGTASLAEDTPWELPLTGDVPRIDIYTEGEAAITSKTDYLTALFMLHGGGVFDDITDSVWIKGRGNSSWYAPKKPYRLKFFHKQTPFGLTKSRHFVLIANYIDPTLAVNALALKTAQLVGSSYAGHGIPVEFYLNGAYQGSYLFTEKTRVGKGSVDIDEENSVLIELDINYDEPQRFISDSYYLPVMIHYPKEADMPVIRQRWNEIEEAVFYKKDITALIDTAALFRYMFVYDLFCNNEVGHPKSVFCSYTELSMPSPVVFGPVWDFDWSCGFLGEEYFTLPFLEPFEQPWFDITPVTGYSGAISAYNGYPFFYALARHPQIRKGYAHFCYDTFEEKVFEHLMEWLDDYAAYITPSADHDSTLWPGSADHVAATQQLKQWLTNRASLFRERVSDVLIQNNIGRMQQAEQQDTATDFIFPDGRISLTPCSGFMISRSILPDGSVQVRKTWTKER